MRRRRLILLGIVAVLAAGIGVVVQATDALSALEDTAIDARFKVRDDNTVPKDVVVVGIDGDTIAALGRLPFPRSDHARVIRALKRSGAQVIAYDIEFVGATKPRQDNALI